MKSSAFTNPLPTLLNVGEFLEQRIDELQKLKCELEATSHKWKKKRSFQLLPKWDRRRAQSHNPYRVPRAYRGGILKELEYNQPKDCRRRRRDRRRTRNLLFYYHKRSCKQKWLEETHFWHAKRFHMKSMWNYRLAWEACEKQKRRCYRFATHKSVIHDRSYIEIIELCASVEYLKQFFVRFNASAIDIMFTPKMLSGGIRGSIHLFYPLCLENPDSMSPAHPKPRCLGDVSFLWCSTKCFSRSARLWLFLHPSLANETRQVFQQYAHMPSCELDPMQQPESFCPLQMRTMRNISIFEISGRLALTNLFRILRLFPTTAHLRPKDISEAEDLPNSHSHALWNVLRPCAFYDPEVPNGAVLNLCVKVPKVLGPFPPVYSEQHQNSKIEDSLMSVQSLLTEWPYETLGAETSSFFSPCSFSGSAIAPLKITTRSRKRKNISKILKRLKCIQQQYKGCDSMCTPKSSKQNPLLRSSSPQFSPLREKCLGCEDIVTTYVLVIRRCTTPGNCGYNGYDIVFPAFSGASRFWTLLSRLCTCAIGVKERHHLLTGAGIMEFPWDYPETEAGKLQSLQQAREVSEIYKKRPPSKRVNYAVFGVPYPFYPDWESLTSIGFPRHFRIAHNPLREVVSSPMCVMRPFENVSLWDTMCPYISNYETRTNPAQKFDSIGHFLCAILLTHNATLAEELFRSFERTRQMDNVFLAVRVLPSLKRIPSPQTHLYQMKQLSMQNAFLHGLFTNGYITGFWNVSMENISMPHMKKNLSITEVVPLNHKYKTKNLKGKSNNLFDEFGQLGQASPGYFGLVGFVTSGNYSLRFGHGIGLGCITIKSFLQSLVYLRHTMESFCGSSTVRLRYNNELKKIQDQTSSKLDTFFKLLGNKVLMQLFVPFWFQQCDSSVRYLCWINPFLCPTLSS